MWETEETRTKQDNDLVQRGQIRDFSFHVKSLWRSHPTSRAFTTDAVFLEKPELSHASVMLVRGCRELEEKERMAMLTFRNKAVAKRIGTIG